jgi:Domain of unknown function DUF29
MSNLTQQSNYDKDFYAWALNNVELLRQKKFEEIDVDNIAQEIESMGKSNKRALFSHLAILMAHLLKWKYQPVRRSKSWSLTIKNQGFELTDLLNESPSLKNEISSQFAHSYQKALIIAAQETFMEEKDFPKECPFSIEQCLSDEFFPN